MATQAASSHGTAFMVEVEGVYTRIAEVLDITGPTMNMPVEMVYSDDPGAYPAVVRGGIEAHEATFDINYTGVATQTLLRAAIQSGDVQKFRVEYPVAGMDATEFEGTVTRFEPLAPVEGVLKASVAIIATSHLAFV